MICSSLEDHTTLVATFEAAFTELRQPRALLSIVMTLLC